MRVITGIDKGKETSIIHAHTLKLGGTLGLKLRVRNRKIIFLFLTQNICCAFSKEPSQ